MRGTLPRVRIDQLMGFAWKWMMPAALANIFVTAAAIIVMVLILELPVTGVPAFPPRWRLACAYPPRRAQVARRGALDVDNRALGADLHRLGNARQRHRHEPAPAGGQIPDSRGGG